MTLKHLGHIGCERFIHSGDIWRNGSFYCRINPRKKKAYRKWKRNQNKLFARKELTLE